jgi:hypothetical protein
VTKVMTVAGTRPEIIGLSEVIKRLDATADRVLVQTGQNYDYELNEILFLELGCAGPTNSRYWHHQHDGGRPHQCDTRCADNGRETRRFVGKASGAGLRPPGNGEP